MAETALGLNGDVRNQLNTLATMHIQNPAALSLQPVTLPAPGKSAPSPE